MSGMSSDICRSTCKLDLSDIGTWNKFRYSTTSLAFLESDIYFYFNIVGHKLLSTKIHDYFLTKLIYFFREGITKCSNEVNNKFTNTRQHNNYLLDHRATCFDLLTGHHQDPYN